jgi:hypothetical protein
MPNSALPESTEQLFSIPAHEQPNFLVVYVQDSVNSVSFGSLPRVFVHVTS